MSIIWALIILSLVVLFHEFGHFLLAKANGVHVVEFSLGMGPRILSREWRGTRYSWKLVPLGGSCMMQGEDDSEGAQEEGSFLQKSVWARLSIIAAGPFFNFILAFFLAVIIVGNYGYDPAYIAGIVEGSAAQEAGLQEGDLITKMNRKNIRLGRDVTLYINSHQGEDITLTYKRDGQSHTVHISPRQDETGRYIMGVTVNPYFTKGSVWDVLRYGAAEVRLYLDMTVQSLRMLLVGEAGIQDLSGPVGVVEMIDDTYTESAKMGLETIVANMIGIAILISANLGVLNLLPIPALDGGRILFLLIEAIRGKRINPEKEAMVHFAGMVALMLLMVVVLYNDVMKLM